MARKEKGSGAKKYDRNRKWCEVYRNRDQRARNKVARLLRHIRRYGLTDHTAVHCYNNLPMSVKPRDRLTLTPEKTKRKRIAPRVPMTGAQATKQLMQAAQ